MLVKLTGVNWRKLKSLIFIKLNECSLQKLHSMKNTCL